MLEEIIPEQDIVAALEHSDVILPYPFHPYPVNAEEDLHKYCKLHAIEAMKKIVKAKYPDYMPQLLNVLASEHISYCNMFIARRDFVNDYCTWLFDILFGVEAAISFDGDEKEHARLYGYLSEVLLNVYVQKNSLKCTYCYLLATADEESFIHKALVRYLKTPLKKILISAGLFEKVCRICGKIYVDDVRYEVLKKIISGEPADAISYDSLEGVKHYLESAGLARVKVQNDELFCRVSGKLDSIADIAVYIPKQEISDFNYRDAVDKILKESEAKRMQHGIMLPRVVLGMDVSDNIRDIFNSAGIRIIDKEQM